MHCGHGDGSCVELEIRFEQIVDRGRDRDAVLRSNFCSTSCIRLKGSHKLDACIGLLQFAIDAKMVAPEGTTAGYGDAQIGLAADAILPRLRRL